MQQNARLPNQRAEWVAEANHDGHYLVQLADRTPESPTDTRIKSTPTLPRSNQPSTTTPLRLPPAVLLVLMAALHRFALLTEVGLWVVHGRLPQPLTKSHCSGSRRR